MADNAFESSKHVLDPVDRASEVLFGLIMVLSITGSLSVVGAGQVQVRAMLFAALGCNLAWGLIDGVFYLMGCVAETARKFMVWDAVRKTADPEAARRDLAGMLPTVVASTLQPKDLEAMRLRLQALPEPPGRSLIHRSDWLGALSVFLLVFLTTFPVVIPFIFMKNITEALLVSRGIAIVLLYLAGHRFGRYIGRHPVHTGIMTVTLGVLLVGLTIALGG